MNMQLYRVWRGMFNRCYNQNQKSYKNYGAKGIRVCDEWHGKEGFKNFIKDLGERPVGATIERINSRGNYEPSNCRWATRLEQANNKSNNRMITINGLTQTKSQWAKSHNINVSLFHFRVKNGMDPLEALTKPVAKRPNSTLTDDNIVEIRNSYPMITTPNLAKKFGVSKKAILNILHNRTYQDVQTSKAS